MRNANPRPRTHKTRGYDTTAPELPPLEAVTAHMVAAGASASAHDDSETILYQDVPGLAGVAIDLGSYRRSYEKACAVFAAASTRSVDVWELARSKGWTLYQYETARATAERECDTARQIRDNAEREFNDQLRRAYLAGKLRVTNGAD